LKSSRQQQRPELLAPAGSMEAFFAAVDAGADAVYTGLKEFSARAKAKNFSLKEIEKITHYLQQQNKRLYITLNTLVKENELSQLIDTLGALEEIGVDALIIQDLAVWKLAKDHFPGLELHASTQMTIHNAAGVKMLERMGFTRGVLAREMTLPEIAEIRQQTTLELEQFIHGALCFSYSGQCYFSSFLSGKSGNRGKCAQPCRRNHRYRQQEGYYFSPNDLSAIDLLPELEQAGICSLKIEGRMKSAEYVHKVIRAYRQVLDAPAEQRKAVLKEAKVLLKESFGRQPPKDFYRAGNPVIWLSHHTKGPPDDSLAKSVGFGVARSVSKPKRGSILVPDYEFNLLSIKVAQPLRSVSCCRINGPSTRFQPIVLSPSPQPLSISFTLVIAFSWSPHPVLFR
jgi:putative protease